MPERIESEQKVLHPDRKLVTPMDVFIGAIPAQGRLLSGGAVSGGGLNLLIVSSPSNLRLVNMHLFNREGGWLEIQFRDGNSIGDIKMGPYRLQAYSERQLPYEQVVGRYFTSSIYVEVRSGWTSQPLSNGVDIDVSVVKQPTDWYE